MSVRARWKTSSLLSFYIQKTKAPGDEAICGTLSPRTERDLESAVGIPSPAPWCPTLLPLHCNGQYRCPRSFRDPSRPLAFSFPHPSSRAFPAPGSRRAGWMKGCRTSLLPIQTLWPKKGCKPRPSPWQKRAPPPPGRGQGGLGSRVCRRPVPSRGRGLLARSGRVAEGEERRGGEGRGGESLERSGPESRSPPAASRRRAGLVGGTRGGGRDCGGAAGARARGVTGGGGGGAALAAATRPPGPGRDTRPRPGTHRAHSLSKQCSRAPGGAAGGSATDGEAGGARPRGEPARRFLRIQSLFVWRTWPQRGAPGERCGSREGDPLSASPGVTGGRWRRVERPDRVRPGLDALRLEHTGAGGVFSIHWRIALFKTGKLSFEFGEGKPTVQLVLLGLLFCLGQETEALFELLMGKTSFLRQEYCQRGGEGEPARDARTGVPGGRWFGAPG